MESKVNMDISLNNHLERITFDKLFKVPNDCYLFIHSNSSVPNYEEYGLSHKLDKPNFYGTLFGIGVIGMDPVKLGYIWKNSTTVQICSVNKTDKYSTTRLSDNKLILENENNIKHINIKSNCSLDDLICATTIDKFKDYPLVTQQFPLVLLGLYGMKRIEI